MADVQFFVVLGPDGAGKSSVMAETSARLPEWRMVSTDEAFLGAKHGLLTELRRSLVKQPDVARTADAVLEVLTR